MPVGDEPREVGDFRLPAGTGLPFVQLGSNFSEPEVVAGVAVGGGFTCVAMRRSSSAQLVQGASEAGVKCWGMNEVGQTGTGDSRTLVA